MKIQHLSVILLLVVLFVSGCSLLENETEQESKEGGFKVAFTTEENIWIYDSNEDALTKIEADYFRKPQDSEYDELDVQFSPNGRYLAFVGLVPDDWCCWFSELYIYDTRDDILYRVSNTEDDMEREFVFSPESDEISFVSGLYGWELITFNLDNLENPNPVYERGQEKLEISRREIEVGEGMQPFYNQEGEPTLFSVHLDETPNKMPKNPTSCSDAKEGVSQLMVEGYQNEVNVFSCDDLADEIYDNPIWSHETNDPIISVTMFQN